MLGPALLTAALHLIDNRISAHCIYGEKQNLMTPLMSPRLKQLGHAPEMKTLYLLSFELVIRAHAQYLKDTKEWK